MKETIKTILKYGATLIAVIVLAGFLRGYVFTVISVSGDSMKPTLHDQNLMILNRMSYSLHDIERFDIVVVETPANFIIKRVIGLPGETVRYESGMLYINDEPVSEPYIVDQVEQYTLDFELADIPGGYMIIPEGQYLVLGDNRRVSEDSRAIGLINESQIIGKTNWVVWPPKEIKIAE